MAPIHRVSAAIDRYPARGRTFAAVLAVSLAATFGLPATSTHFAPAPAYAQDGGDGGSSGGDAGSSGDLGSLSDISAPDTSITTPDISAPDTPVTTPDISAPDTSITTPDMSTPAPAPAVPDVAPAAPATDAAPAAPAPDVAPAPDTAPAVPAPDVAPAAPAPEAAPAVPAPDVAPAAPDTAPAVPTPDLAPVETAPAAPAPDVAPAPAPDAAPAGPAPDAAPAAPAPEAATPETVTPDAAAPAPAAPDAATPETSAPAADASTPTAPAPAAPSGLAPVESPNGFKAGVTGAFGPLGGTVAVARDDQNTSITFGPAEGFGFFGSFGQGKAASENSAQATVQGGLGPAGASLSAGTGGVTGTFTTAEPIQPGLDQTQTYTATLDNNGNLSRTYTEGFGLGFNVGLVSSQTFTFSVSNRTLDAIASFFGSSGSSSSTPPGSEIGGPIPTD